MNHHSLLGGGAGNQQGHSVAHTMYSVQMVTPGVGQSSNLEVWQLLSKGKTCIFSVLQSPLLGIYFTETLRGMDKDADVQG